MNSYIAVAKNSDIVDTSPKSIAFFFWFLLPSMLAGFFLVKALAGNLDYIFCSIGWLCFAVMAFAISLKPRMDFFEPIVLASFAVFLGTTARSVLVTTSGSEKFDYLTEGYTLELIYSNGMYLWIGLFFLCVGYVLTQRARVNIAPLTRLFSRDLSITRIRLLCLVCLAMSLWGSYLFANSVGIDFTNINSISNKRVVYIEGSTGGSYTSFAQFKLLASFAEYGLYILLAYQLSKSRLRIKLFVFDKILILVLFISACVTPFLSSSRMDILLLMINSSIVVYYSRQKRVPLKMLFFVFVLALTVASSMGYLRAVAQDREAESYMSPIESVIGSGNFVDLARTSIIIEEMPKKLEHLYGESLVSFFVFPIPRTLWPTKPNVSLGPIVRSEIYGLPTLNNGFPPGIVAEGYMNFGLFGLLAVPFLFGVFLRFIYNLFKNNLLNPIAIVLYAGIIWRLAFGGIGLNFSQMIAQIVPDIVMLTAFLIFCSKRMSHGS